MKWKYKCIEARNHALFQTIANTAGEGGWELVHVEYTKGYVIGFFKRPLDQSF